VFKKASIILLLLLGAHLNLTALVPATAGQAPPPWWVGGGLFWPFFADTRTLVPAGDLRDTLTPILGITAAVCLLLAGCALLRWLVPASWFRGLIVAGAVASVVLQVVWISGWAVLPLAVDAALLWLVFGLRLTVGSLHGRTAAPAETAQ
jgi:hypothetical protein